MTAEAREDPRQRLSSLVETWGLSIERVVDRAHALVALGYRGRQPVALKIFIRAPDDEWHSGSVLRAFGGRGVIRVLEEADGAVLVERLVPGTTLAREAMDDERATGVIADLIQRMSPGPPPQTAPQVAGLAQSFERYLAGGAQAIQESLVLNAQRVYAALCRSQGATRLLHGDLHHHNVLLDEQQGWLAVDPKGVVGEVEYELGAALRNPAEQPSRFTSPILIERRATRFSKVLGLDLERILRWAFAQAVLAACWELEDNGVLCAGVGWVQLARSVGSVVDLELGA